MNRWEIYQEIPQSRSFHKTKIQVRESSSVGKNQVFNLQFDLAVGVYNGLHPENMTYFSFVVKKEHSCVRNVFDSDKFFACDEIKTLENYFESFKCFLQIVLLLYSTYSVQIDVEDISDDCIADFVEKYEIESFQKIYHEVATTQIEKVNFSKKRKLCFKNIFIYNKIMKFPQNNTEIKTLVTKNIFNNVINFIFGEIVVHHSHVSGDIIGYAHVFCNRKLKENQKLITKN